ncbi:uncharacterized protein METZ01_LOCUS197031, partial [marine metagenome]
WCPSTGPTGCWPPCCGNRISGTGWLCGRGSAWYSTISGSFTDGRGKPTRSAVCRAVIWLGTGWRDDISPVTVVKMPN